MITPTHSEKMEWARFANAAYSTGHNAIGHRFSAYAALATNVPLVDCAYDTLQRQYRAWLIDGIIA